MFLKLSEQEETEKKIQAKYEQIAGCNAGAFTLDEILFLSQAWQARNRDVVLARLTKIVERVTHGS